MLVYNSDAEIERGVKKLAEVAEVVRIKERLHDSSRTSEGWGDVMVNFRMKPNPECTHSVGEEDHICELQFARLKMLRIRQDFGGHEQYFTLRAAIELHEVCCERSSIIIKMCVCVCVCVRSESARRPCF